MKQVKNGKISLFLWCLLSAGLAAAVFITFTAINHIAPLGDASILRNDALHQYAPFLANYIQRIKDGASLLHSWNLGAGVNQYSLIAYYLLSPFNLLALPFKASNIDIAFWLIILVKTAFVGLTSGYCFQKKSEKPNFAAVAFSLAYTFGGFYICYYYNTMWLDALIALPLIALGIENIVNGKKATLYFLSLAYAIFVNFYIGYMICIFAVMYFFYLLFAKDVSRSSAEKAEDEAPISRVLVKFAVSSFIAGMLCAAVILPVYFAINYGPNKSDFDTTGMFFNFFDFLSYHLSGLIPGTVEETKDTAPYLMSSMITLLSLPLFFCLKSVKPNKKIASLVVLVIFYFSFAVPKMNYFWHGFSAPTFLPYRFSFIYLLFILFLAFETFKKAKDIPVWAFGISAALAATAIVYTRFSKFASHFNTKTIVISAVFAVIYTILLLLLKYEKANKKLLYTALVILLVSEITVGNYSAIGALKDKRDFYYDFNQISEAVKLADDGEADGLTRFEIVETKDDVDNYPALYNYNGISTFSSMSDGDFSGTQRMLGNFGNFGNSYHYTTQTPIYNAMFSVDYVLDVDENIKSDKIFYEKVGDVEGGTLYKVKYSLPMGYIVREDIKAWDPYSYLATMVQSQFWKYSTGVFDSIAFQKFDSINYNNCVEVNPDEISQYIIDNPSENEYRADDDHDHDHEHEHEDFQSALDDLEEGTVYEYSLSAENVSQLLKLIGDVYSFKATAEGFSVDFEYTASSSGEFFALAHSGSMQTLKVTRSDGSSTEVYIKNRHISDLGYFEAGEKFTLTVCEPDRPLSEYDAKYPLTDSIQMSVASINEEKFLEGYNQILKNGTLQVDEFDDTYIHGTVNSTIDGFMMMPMPYDLGWTVYVDGEPVELFEHESHIMMFPISVGEHEIEMSYFPQGLKEGIFVSVAAVLGLVLVLLLGRVHKMKLAFEAEEAAKAESTEGAVTSNGEADGKSDKSDNE